MTAAQYIKTACMEKGFSILNLNLRFGLAADGANSWPFRAKAYPPLFDAYPSDFYTFQEANGFQVDFLRRLLPQYGVIGERRPAPDFWQSNVIFHHRRWRCISHDYFFLSETPDIPSKFDKSQWPRQCTMGVYQCNGHSVAVINTHFDFDPEIQRRSAELISRRLRSWIRPGPAVLAGDFNTEPGSSAYEVFSSNQAGFRNVFRPPYAGTHHGFSGNTTGGTIDWILYRGHLTAAGAAVIVEKFNGIYPSDHFPLRADFEWI